jgi:hypothetical protein
MVSDLLTHVERSLAVDVDLNLEPQCESPHHVAGKGPWGHQVHSGPAAYWQIGCCPSGSGLRCAAFVQSLIPGVPFDCDQCGKVSSFDSFRWIEL